MPLLYSKKIEIKNSNYSGTNILAFIKNKSSFILKYFSLFSIDFIENTYIILQVILNIIYMGRPKKLESLGTRIKKLRNGILLTQEQLARKANLSYVSLVKLENDKVDNPSFQTIYKLSKVFGITLDDFVNGVMDDKDLFLSED